MPTEPEPNFTESEFTDKLTREWLRKEFKPEQISQLPSTPKRPALDYVAHAVVTDRLNKVAPGWRYRVEPVVVTGNDGWPHVIAVFGTMSIGSVSRQEVGAVDGPSNYGQELKEAISDFIRRAAMRFGVAIDLWIKGEAEATPAGGIHREGEPPPGPSHSDGPSGVGATGGGSDATGGSGSPSPRSQHADGTPHVWADTWVDEDGKTRPTREGQLICTVCLLARDASKVPSHMVKR